MEKNDVEREERKKEMKESQGRNRPRNFTSLQMDENNLSCSHNMAATIEGINQKLALSNFQEIDVLKENLKHLQKENNDLKDSLSYAHKELPSLKKLPKLKRESSKHFRKVSMVYRTM